MEPSEHSTGTFIERSGKVLCYGGGLFWKRKYYTGLQGFVVENLWVVSGVIFDVEFESGIRISLSRQDFEIFEVMCSKNGVFRYFWGYAQGARHFFGFFLKCHNLALLFPFTMSYWTVMSDFFHKDTAISSFDIDPNNVMSIHIESLVHTILHSKINLENLCFRVTQCNLKSSENPHFSST